MLIVDLIKKNLKIKLQCNLHEVLIFPITKKLLKSNDSTERDNFSSEPYFCTKNTPTPTPLIKKVTHKNNNFVLNIM